MKWFFAYAGESNPNYKKLIRAAVTSAKKNTNLEPWCIYDGAPSDITSWLESQNVQIIYHSSSFSDDISKIMENDLFAMGGRGAMLRVDLPKILAEQGFRDDFILYTDCDVMFVRGIEEVNEMKPEYFACAPESETNNWSYVNTGVMIMNIPNLYATYNDFVSYTRKKMMEDKKWILSSWDQLAYNEYYKGKVTKLPIEYNWKPYWGDHPDIRVVHFHGPKPHHREFLNSGTANQILRELYDRDIDCYKKMFSIWDRFYEEAT